MGEVDWYGIDYLAQKSVEGRKDVIVTHKWQWRHVVREKIEGDIKANAIGSEVRRDAANRRSGAIQKHFWDRLTGNWLILKR